MQIYGNYFGYNTVTPPVIPTDEKGNPVKDDSVFCDPTLGKKPWELTFDELSQTPKNILMYRQLSTWINKLNIEKPGLWWGVDDATGRDNVSYDQKHLFTVALTIEELEKLVPQSVSRNRSINEICFVDHPEGARLVDEEEFDRIKLLQKSFYYFRRREGDGKIEITPSTQLNERNWLDYIARCIDEKAPLPEKVIKDFKERIQKLEKYRKRYAEFL